MKLNYLCMGCMEEKGDAKVCPLCGWEAEKQQESPVQLPPGTVLNDLYVLGGVLGQGGFGITYIGWDIKLERKVAVKEYFPHSIAIRSTNRPTVSIYNDNVEKDFKFGLDKFFNEGKTLAKFQEHPGIVSVLISFKANNTGYIVMEYVKGITLKEYLIQEGGRVPFDKAVKILMPVMDALRAVHNANLLHRDISPDNIYLTDNNQVKLLDFGAARYTLGERSENFSVILKPGYAPEEQYRSRGKQGAWTDIYSLGAVLYRSITGETPPDALDRLDEDIIKPLSHFEIDIAPEKEITLMKTLAVKANDRFQDMESLQKKIAPELIVDDEPRKAGKESGTSTQEHSTIKYKSAKGWIATTVIFVIASIIFLTGWISTGQKVNMLKSLSVIKEHQIIELEEKVKELEGKLERELATGREEKIKELEEKLETELATRKRLAENWPLTVTKIQLRNTAKGGGKLSEFTSRFKKEEIRFIRHYAAIQNNWVGIKDIKGKLGVKYIKPNGTLKTGSKSPSDYSFFHSFDIHDLEEVVWGWGHKSKGAFGIGTHHIEFWWEGKKIAETRFEVYE